MITNAIKLMRCSSPVVRTAWRTRTSTPSTLHFSSISSPTKKVEQTNNNQQNSGETAKEKVSSITLFKLNYPVHPSILEYIESIGVGIPTHIRRKRSTKLRRTKAGGRTKQRVALDAIDEREFFLQRSSRGGEGSRLRQRARSRNNRLIGGKVVGGNNDNNDYDNTSSWLAPPPFAANTLSSMSIIKNETTADKDYKIRRYPVKIIGSVSHKGDRLPPTTKGFPEIALAGRSNVGKSTLLNALLYGNINQPDPSKAPKANKGRIPIIERSKMPKGIKASTSDRPGETRNVTFYQLTSIMTPTTKSPSTTEYDCGSDTDSKSINSDDNNKKANRKAKPTAASNAASSSGRSSNFNGDFHFDKETSRIMSMILVDLPGYGFAYASEEKAKQWREVMQHYLVERGSTLKRILLLIDARHGMKQADHDFIESLELYLNTTQTRSATAINDTSATSAAASSNAAIPKKTRRNMMNLPPIQIILTKCDLVSQKDLARRVVQVREQLSDTLLREPSSLPVMLVSAKAGIGYNNIKGNRARGGILELQREIASLMPPSNAAKSRQRQQRQRKRKKNFIT